jgi:hypothetical protein
MLARGARDRAVALLEELIGAEARGRRILADGERAAVGELISELRAELLRALAQASRAEHQLVAALEAAHALS